MRTILPAPMPVDELRALVGYDPETGRFWWNVTRNSRAQAGTEPRYRTGEGYIQFMIARKLCSAHRIAWYLTFEEWPPNYIDHINGIRDDNRIANLRLATGFQNMANAAWLNRKSSSGFRGVYRNGKKWQAQIRGGADNRHRICLGSFTSPEEAYEAVCAAIRETRGEFARVD